MLIDNIKIKLCASSIISIYDINQQNTVYDDAKIDELIASTLSMLNIDINDDEIEAIRKEVYYRCKIKSNDGVMISDNYEHYNWYDQRERSIEHYYWMRYREFLLSNQHFGLNVVNKLENETLRDLLNNIGDPKSSEDYLRRGLIIGDVQSGKTSTYIGLICKAADAGVKVIILLTGTVESLREQTQERVEEGFVGYDTTKYVPGKTDCYVGVGLQDRKISVTVMTTRENDFVGTANKIVTSIESNKVVLLIVKKNVTVLNRLIDWFKRLNAGNDGRIDYPMLLIDDECDNASINTNKEDDDPTKVNKLIRSLASVFKKSTYVGFTATPFANVFINPKTTPEMENSDLFPENFIYCLPVSTDYLGAKDYFLEDGKYHNSLHYIEDAGQEEDDGFSFYSGHKKDWDDVLPDSLTDAIYSFFIINAIRDLRGDNTEHRSMLINISRFILVQDKIRQLVVEIVEDAYSAIKYHISSNMSNNRKHPIINLFEKVWIKFFLNTEFSWNTVALSLFNAIERVQVKVINSGGKTEKLDYKANKSNGLRVIAIGGLALSRGLTLEGLVVSYFFRNTTTYDVLMQMGRWFGYRKNYSDLVNIWIGEQSAEWYANITEAIEELKKDMIKMRASHLTPKDFGIRVRNDSDELQITATNKMRAATDRTEYESYFGTAVQAPYVLNDPIVNQANIDAVCNLIRSAKLDGCSFYKSKHTGNHPALSGVKKTHILKFMTKFKVFPFSQTLDLSSIHDFVMDCSELKLDQWDVLFMEGTGRKDYLLEGEYLDLVSRSFTFDQKNNRLCLGHNGQLAGPSDTKYCIINQANIMNAELQYRQMYREAKRVDFEEGKTYPFRIYFEYIQERSPLIIVYLVDLNTSTPEDSLIKDKYNDLPVASISIGIPTVNSEVAKKHLYKINRVYIDKLLEESKEE